MNNDAINATDIAEQTAHAHGRLAQTRHLRATRCRGIAPGWRKAIFLCLSVGVAIVIAIVASPADAPAQEAEPLAPLLLADDEVAIQDDYIVVLEPLATAFEATSATSQLQGAVQLAGGTVTHTYQTALTGFAAEMDEATVADLRASPFVSYIEQNSVVTVTETQENPEWNLDRLDQPDLPLDASYTYDSSMDGSGVTVYVLDTGIRSTHQELAGRVAGGRSFIGGTAEDCNGHGTHVAGTIASTTYGVAKDADVFAIRVLGCDGVGTTASVIAGLDWVALNHRSPAVVNLSLGAPANQAADDAVVALTEAGVLSVVAAGNDGADACDNSPARVPGAVTVAGSSAADYRAFLSNHGSCVDLFAPGFLIVSLDITSDTATTVRIGTSMAAPHVAGIAAAYLESAPGASPEDVTDAILQASAVGKIINPGGSPNRLAQVIRAPAVPTCDGQPATLVGTDGDDTIVGTAGADVIYTGSGNDVIDGRGGLDLICSGDGNDVIFGGLLADRIHAGGGQDQVWGRDGDDVIFGGAGDDEIHGGRGADYIGGGPGNDVLFGEQGNDNLTGDDGYDGCWGGLGFDIAGQCEVTNGIE